MKERKLGSEEAVWSILILIFLTLCTGVAAWLVFLWAVKSGQYDDAERPKYRMLDEDDKDRKSNNNASDEAGKR